MDTQGKGLGGAQPVLCSSPTPRTGLLWWQVCWVQSLNSFFAELAAPTGQRGARRTEAGREEGGKRTGDFEYTHDLPKLLGPSVGLGIYLISHRAEGSGGLLHPCFPRREM